MEEEDKCRKSLTEKEVCMSYRITRTERPGGVSGTRITDFQNY